MALEIEKKFLVTQPPADMSGFKKADIRQGYLSVSNPGVAIRIRSVGNKYFLTIKSGTGLVRHETELEIGREEFNELWKIPGLKIISKTRYVIPFDGVVIELDFFEEKLNGLIIAEIEFDSVEKSQQFKPPDWFGEDITYKSEYSNSSLALNSGHA